MQITVLIPCLNEEKTIANVLSSSVLHYGNDSQFIVIDNGSTDKSLHIISDIISTIDANIRLLTCSHKGKGNAIKAALPYIKHNHIILQDADIEYSINDTKQLAEMHLLHDFDMSIGVRESSMLFKSHLTNSLIRWLLKLRFGKTLPDILTGSRIVRLSLLKECSSAKFGLETELSKIVLRDNMRVQIATCGYTPRIIGKKIRAHHLTEIIYKAIT